MPKRNSSTGLRVRTLEQTCLVVPSQWEGHLDDGRMFYVRFRNGHFEVRISPGPTEDVTDAVRAPAFFEWFSEDPDDGFMEEVEMMDLAGSALDFSHLRAERSS